ncbi:hypothetical protein AQUCO_03800098v1 [Aquilegia coerulea]|uniref:Uncharacterized protein n=2 Tax=Aquilegia coerulea TaxID=218851 RepID=A0A2G5CSM9_AQUCA|nr:hypothetical protein AQUCO_03800098v1 [Aquilegia coerulea]
MKCEAIACIWSGAPPLHEITATAVLNEPPTLYTGGSDGSIIWWNLSTSYSNQSNKEIWPMAMLCGHATTIADLDICVPTTVDAQEEKEISSNVVMNSTSSGYGALISASTDGMLCIWSRNSGHCLRRRNLPPWVGSPSSVSTLTTSPRYVCIACSSVDTAHSSSQQTMEHVETGESMVDREFQHRSAWTKYAVVIVDSYSLNIVRTVFHGGLSIGQLKFMAVVPSGKYMEVSSVVLADVYGKMQSIILLEESDQDRDGKTNMVRSSSHSMMSILSDVSSDGDQVVSISAHGRLLVLVYRSRCIFCLVDNGIAVGEISLSDGPLCDDGLPLQSHVIGGMFLVWDKDGKVLDTEEQQKEFTESFLIWNNKGAALVYQISGSDHTFNFELSCEIPAVTHDLDVKLTIRFCHINSFILRIESTCFIVEESLFWKPHITVWSLSDQNDPHRKLDLQGTMLGEGGILGEWTKSSRLFSMNGSCKYNANVISISGEIQEASHENGGPILTVANGCYGEGKNNSLVLKENTVSSSMVLFERFCAPYAIVYGFFSGRIEVVHFDISFQELNSSGSPHHEVKPHVSKQYFSGHTGPILCLAAHQLVGAPSARSFSKILVSGSMDCTIRLWDLDTSDLITVMHHHVAPVRQIILPPAWTDRPWNDCFLSVGEDCCVALASFETLRVERIFAGHPIYPSLVVWDGARGYIACLCKNNSGISDAVDVLCLWDVKTGSRERVLRGPAAHSMFDHFCEGINLNFVTDNVLGGITSASSLLLPINADMSSQSHSKHLEMGVSSSNTSQRTIIDLTQSTIAHANEGKSARHLPSAKVHQNNMHPVKCSCPFPGIATLRFDLPSLMFPCQNHSQIFENRGKIENELLSHKGPQTPSSFIPTSNDISDTQENEKGPMEEHEWLKFVEGCILRLSLSFLHLWGVDHELDGLLISEMEVNRPQNFIVASGLQGDRGSMTLTFPGPRATLELWRSSSEYCAIRSLTMVALAQRMVSLSLSSSAASSSLAAFYTRHFSEQVPDLKPPSLQILVSFWQDESEHVRMAARSLFHCAASRAIPHPLCGQKLDQITSLPLSSGDLNDEQKPISTRETSASSSMEPFMTTEIQDDSQSEDSSILTWLESFEMRDWISCVGGTSQDAMASHIIVAAALAIWYPSLVKLKLAALVVHPLIKLVMAMNEKYSSAAAELLAEGMESIWKACIGPEIPRLLGDIFFQVECVSGASANSATQNAVAAMTIREVLVGILLPSLAMADIPGFLHVIESQIWSTASDSPVHLVSLMTLIRVVRGSPKPLAQYLDKVINFILQTIDHGNSVMRKTCLVSSMAALKEVIRAFPMVSVNDSSTRLAVGDPIGKIESVTIRVYDMQSVTKVKVLDASGPPGLPSLLGGSSEMTVTTAISALCFSPDGEGLVAFNDHGSMIRWWSLGSAWWEKISRNLVPVQCTKLIFVPPWEGSSPNYSRASIMETITGHDRQVDSEGKSKGSSDVSSPRLLIYNLDLSYHLAWVGERKVLLTRHGHELGTFQL